jgi:hypothetical protein
MTDFSWHAVYYSDLQSLYALLIVPIAFLAWRLTAGADEQQAAVPGAARFVSGLTLLFAIETMIDPIATGPLMKLDFFRDIRASEFIPFFFVLLGDLRVLLLAIGVSRPERSLRQNLTWAFSMALIVPIVTGLGFTLTRWIWPDVHGQVLWMIYEFAFLALCIFLARVWVPRSVPNDPAVSAFLKSIFGYSAAYYALWWVADVFIVVADLDLGWAIRIVPNQLYYAFWAPFVYWRFFSVRPPSVRPPSLRPPKAA